MNACGVLKLDYSSVSFQMQQGLSLATCSSDVCCAPCCMAYYKYPVARYITDILLQRILYIYPVACGTPFANETSSVCIVYPHAPEVGANHVVLRPVKQRRDLRQQGNTQTNPLSTHGPPMLQPANSECHSVINAAQYSASYIASANRSQSRRSSTHATARARDGCWCTTSPSRSPCRPPARLPTGTCHTHSD